MSAGAVCHTPGPWVWHDDYTLAPACPDPKRHNVHTILDLESTGYGFNSSPADNVRCELDANRRLIAAAPDMLAALRGLLESGGNDLEAIDAAHAAIAKAGGQS